MKPLSLFDDERLTLSDALDITVQSLHAYGADHRWWAKASRRHCCWERCIEPDYD